MDHETIRDPRLWQEQDMQQTTTKDNGNHIKRGCQTLTHCTYCKKKGHRMEDCTSTEEELTTELTRKILGSDWDKAEPRRKEQSRAKA